MTPEQRQIIIAIGDTLRASPMSWEQIPEQSKQTIIEIMRPRPSFTADQREFLRNWWLQVDDAQLEKINADLPPNTVCEPRLDGDGNKWVNADYFTDAVEENGRLHAVLPHLLGLTLHHLTEDYWPVKPELLT